MAFEWAEAVEVDRLGLVVDDDPADTLGAHNDRNVAPVAREAGRDPVILEVEADRQRRARGTHSRRSWLR